MGEPFPDSIPHSSAKGSPILHRSFRHDRGERATAFGGRDREAACESPPAEEGPPPPSPHRRERSSPSRCSTASIAQFACFSPDATFRAGIIERFNESKNASMEADQLNLIENSLSDLATRTSELRRYL